MKREWKIEPNKYLKGYFRVLHRHRGRWIIYGFSRYQSIAQAMDTIAQSYDGHT